MIDARTQTALIGALREAARDQVLPRFRNLGAGEVDTKTGPEDLVTVADRAAEDQLTRAVGQILPGAHVVGEEAVSDAAAILDRLSAPGLSVIIDPIDGTANYAHGNASFGMILAVAVDGRTEFGVLYDPVCDDWVAASRGGGAWFQRGDQRRTLRVRSERDITAQTGYLPIYNFPADRHPKLAALWPQVGRMSNLRCSCHEYRILLTGHADFMVAAQSKPWDHAAGMLALAEAGGDGGALSGAPYELTDPGAVLVAGTGPDTRKTIAHMLSEALADS